MNEEVRLSRDPQQRIALGPMTVRQIIAIGFCVVLNALDGFDVLSISFASPGIAEEWGIGRGALGVVLSLELIGMAVGSILLGQLADSMGRRRTAFLCLSMMASGMLFTAYVSSLQALAAARLFTGLGIGGMLATSNALVAEYASDRWRGVAVAAMAAGYPLGAIAGGAFASHLLAEGGWRDVFTLGAVMSGACLPMLAFLLPETVSFAARGNEEGRLERVNRALQALGHSPMNTLDRPACAPDKSGVAALFSDQLRVTTILLTVAYFAHIMTFYFVLKWIPKIVADMGFSAGAAGGVLVWANVGGLLGGLSFGALNYRLALRGLLLTYMAASAVLVIIFGQGQPDLARLSIAAAAAGFATNGAVVGLYALVAASFPSAVRAGGTGFVIGVGRAGAALGPVIGGFLFQAGFTLPIVAAAMASGSLLAMWAIQYLTARRAGLSAESTR